MKQHILLSIAGRDDAFDGMIAELSRVADVTVCGLDGFSLRGVDIFVGKKMSESALGSADRLKAVFAYKTGVDDFPLAALDRMGVKLFNSHVNSRYIAEYAFALALSLTCRIAEFDRKMRDGDWVIDSPNWYNLFDMKVGLAGYGGIGRAMHELLNKVGIECFTVDRGKDYNGITALPSLDTMCEQTDLIIASLPATPETDRMFNARVFAKMKGKFFVNVGRCNCVDEDALYASLSNGELKGAAIDTWREKATANNRIVKPFDRPFDKLDNIILSSHKAMQVTDGHAKYVRDTLDNILLYLSGNSPKNIVNTRLGY